MDILTSATHDAVMNAAVSIGAEIIVKRASAQGITLSTHEIRRLKAHIREGKLDSFNLKRWTFWRRIFWQKEAIKIGITKDDEEQFKSLLDEIEKKVPEIIVKTMDDIAEDIFRSLESDLREVKKVRRRESKGFRQRLQSRWRAPLDRMHMLLSIAQELGAKVNEEARNSPDTPKHLVEVLTRSHGRAKQVAEEILCLLECGYADGAMARWRTLHEIAVVALFLNVHGDELAERYILHEDIETRRGAYEYQQHHERMGHPPIPKNELDALDRTCEAAIQKFGKPFGTPYGWTAKILNKDKPTFSDITISLGIDHRKPHYRLASHNIHASPKGVFFKMGLIKDADIILAGPSNLGLADPGCCTAISLVQVSSTLGTLYDSMDNLVTLKVMKKLSDEIQQVFLETQHRIEGTNSSKL